MFCISGEERACVCVLPARSLNVWAKEGRTGPAEEEEFADKEGEFADDILVTVERDIVEGDEGGGWWVREEEADQRVQGARGKRQDA